MQLKLGNWAFISQFTLQNCDWFESYWWNSHHSCAYLVTCFIIFYVGTVLLSQQYISFSVHQAARLDWGRWCDTAQQWGQNQLQNQKSDFKCWGIPVRNEYIIYILIGYDLLQLIHFHLVYICICFSSV